MAGITNGHYWLTVLDALSATTRNAVQEGEKFFFFFLQGTDQHKAEKKKSESSDVMITVLCVYKSCYYMMQLE